MQGSQVVSLAGRSGPLIAAVARGWWKPEDCDDRGTIPAAKQLYAAIATSHAGTDGGARPPLLCDADDVSS